MTVGQVVKFDAARGFGFVAPSDGSEDVFLHVNDLLVPERAIHPGVTVEFVVQPGDRGPKASAIRLASAPGAAPQSNPRLQVQPQVPQVVQPAAELEATCDVLSKRELSSDVVDLLLAVAPSLSGVQILGIRDAFVVYAEERGWTEEHAWDED